MDHSNGMLSKSHTHVHLTHICFSIGHMDACNVSYNAQEKKIKEERARINKFKIKQPQATKQRAAQLEKLTKSDDYVKKPPFIGKPFKLCFADVPRLIPEVADIKGLVHSYGDGVNRLSEDADLFVEKGDRIAVLGPNCSVSAIQIHSGLEER